MLRKAYSIYDSKTGVYSTPFYALTKGEAIRSFTDSCNDNKTMLFRYPDDYTLFEVGEFDDLKGCFIAYLTPVSCGLANEFKEKDVA